MADNTPSETIQTRSNAVRRLSVLLVVPWDQESGGVASVVGYVARHLNAHGHRVLFLHPGRPERIRYRTTKWGFEGVELNLRSPFLEEHPLRSVVAFLVTFPFTLFQLIRLLRKHDIDIVNIHYAGPAFFYFAVCRWLLPIKLVISIHGTDVLPFKPLLVDRSLGPMRILLRAADLIVGPSWAFLRRCNELLTSLSARQIMIHNGIDLRELESPAFAESGEGEGQFILSVATHEEWKGLDVLIRAVALLREEGQTVRLVLAGDGSVRSSNTSPQRSVYTSKSGLSAFSRDLLWPVCSTSARFSFSPRDMRASASPLSKRSRAASRSLQQQSTVFPRSSKTARTGS
jgi:glycosyltransferase involved in cell wall biosynthesis